MSTVDGFFGYNQIAMHPDDDREKIDFTTPWGTLMYDKMPFGLMNAGVIFQRAMDISFVGEKEMFVVIYLDDVKSEFCFFNFGFVSLNFGLISFFF